MLITLRIAMNAAPAVLLICSFFAKAEIFGAGETLSSGWRFMVVSGTAVAYISLLAWMNCVLRQPDVERLFRNVGN